MNKTPSTKQSDGRCRIHQIYILFRHICKFEVVKSSTVPNDSIRSLVNLLEGNIR
jgi:hypothetical protein